MEISQNEKLYLFNYYIENGTFSNLSKSNQRLYKKLLGIKKEEKEFEDNTLTEYLEIKLIPNKKYAELDSTYTRLLRDHFFEYKNLTNSPVSNALEKHLARNASKLGITVDELKKKIETVSIYPEVTNPIVNRINIRDYNSLLGAIGITLFTDMNERKNIGADIFEPFDDVIHLRLYEPGYYTFLESRIPRYCGPLRNPTDNLKYVVEGTKYYGENLNLESVPTLLNDLFFVVKGYISNKNIPPSTGYKIFKMIKEAGSLNWIGFDTMDLLSDLDNLTFRLGFNSISELLADEGYEFVPVTNDRVNIIPRYNKYEVIIDGFDEGVITIDATVKKYLEDMNLVQTLEVHSGDYHGSLLHILTYKYEEKHRFVHELITRSNALTFKDRNSLNVTTENLIGG